MSVEAQTAVRSNAALGPVLALAAFMGGLLYLLFVPLVLPIGPMYWDLAIYFDAAQRIYTGQIHSIDFAAPVGPLGYYLFAHGLRLMPNAHPLLLAQWSILLVTGPLMLLITAEISRRSVSNAWALLLPFMLFTALPFNLVEYFPYPGVDGFGIYNRQTCHVLYVLVCALLFVRSSIVMAIVVIVAAVSLFFLKITGFVAGGFLFAFAVLAGRIGWGVLLSAIAGFVVAIGALQYETGIPLAYVQDIAGLVDANSGTLLRRVLTAASVEFKVVGTGGLLVLTLLWLRRDDMFSIYRENASYHGHLHAISAIFNAPVSWLAALLFASTAFETQNTGSHGFIAVWPGIWLILQRLDDYKGKSRTVVAVLCAAVTLPSVVNIVHRAARTAASAPIYITLEQDNLRSLGWVSTKQDILDHLNSIEKNYIEHRQAYTDLAHSDALPGLVLYSEPNFQLGWLRELDKLVPAVKRWERQTGTYLETVYSADFANPIAWLLDRSATPHVQIGADVDRTFQHTEEGMIDALKATDAIFLPRCPDTKSRREFRDMVAPALAGRRAVEITPCYTMMIRR